MSNELSGLITNRTAADYDRWKTLRDKGYPNMTAAEKAEWNSAAMKGCYNAGDLNRVGAALNYVRGRLAAAGYIAAGVFTARTDWALGDIPTAADLSYYLGCVAAVRQALALYAATPPAPADCGALSFSEANDIEKIILDADELITNMLAARYFCGELYSGEVI